MLIFEAESGFVELSDTHRVHVVVHRARVLKLEVAAPREQEVVRAHPAGALLDEGGHRMREGDDVRGVGRRLLRQVQLALPVVVCGASAIRDGGEGEGSGYW